MLLVHSKQSNLVRKGFLLLVSTESYSISRKSTVFCQPQPRFSHLKAKFLAKFIKSLVNFLGEILGNNVVKFGLSVFCGSQGGGASCFAKRSSEKSVDLASCNFSGPQLTACQACFLKHFYSRNCYAFDY